MTIAGKDIDVATERVLAYIKATLIDSDELIKVTGGASHAVIKPSIVVTSRYPFGQDCVYD